MKVRTNPARNVATVAASLAPSQRPWQPSPARPPAQ